MASVWRGRAKANNRPQRRHPAFIAEALFRSRNYRPANAWMN
jgi:hypothetical protein